MEWTTKRKSECGKSNCCLTHQQESGESLHSCLSATANNKVYFYHPVDTSNIFTWVNSSTWLATSRWKCHFFSFFKLSSLLIGYYLQYLLTWNVLCWRSPRGCPAAPEELLSSFSGGSGALWGGCCGQWVCTAQGQGSLAKDQQQRPRALLGYLSASPVQRARFWVFWVIMDKYFYCFVSLLPHNKMK